LSEASLMKAPEQVLQALSLGTPVIEIIFFI